MYNATMALKKRCLFVLIVLLAFVLCLHYSSLEPLTAWTSFRQTPALRAPALPSPSSGAELFVHHAGRPAADRSPVYLPAERHVLSSVEQRYDESPAVSLQNPQISTETAPPLTFVVTRSFGGQLTRALKNMMMQQCWARELGPGARIVEPFSRDSQLLHTTQIWDAVRRGKTRNVARFSDYFDFDSYNNASLEDGGAPLITWEEFLLRAPRRVIAVVTPPASCHVMVNHHLKNTVDKFFKEFLKNLQKMNFNILKIVPINCYDRNRSQRLMRLLQGNVQSSTIVFSSWRNYNVARTWLDISGRCNISDKYPAARLKPSPKMRRHTLNYRRRVLGAERTIAIMLRVERFLTLRSSHRSDETVDSCLEKTLAVYFDLKRDPRWVGSEPFLTLDIGRFGSGLMQSDETVVRLNDSLEAVTESVTKLLVRVYGGRWKSLGEWEDSFLEATEGIGERGYVAMLQRGVAVDSDCLVLMGGGSFQEVAANHYLRAHPDPSHQCLHVVCPATALTTTLDNHGRKRSQA